MSNDPVILVILFAVAGVASAVDAIAGGGGLLTLPALLIAGLDPVAAIATNKVQSSVGATLATFVFWRRGLIDGPLSVTLVISGALFAAAGALV